MQYEIERKWLVENPQKINFPVKEKRTVYQWYLVAAVGAQVRVSKTILHFDNDDVRYSLNIKNGEGLTRKEVVIELSYADFRKLIAQCGDIKPIKKSLTVFFLPDARELEVSQIDDDWFYAEIEFPNEVQANAYNLDIPGAGLFDVTDQKYYTMKSYWERTRGT